MLQQLFAPQLVVLYILVASTLYVHFRGRERLRIARQIGDHSTYLAPYNVRRGLHPRRRQEQRLGLLFVLQERLEAVLPEMV
jgi:hypothetical protein